MVWMMKARAILVFGFALSIAACETAPRYRDVAQSVAAQPEGTGRIFIYGDSVSWKGARLGRVWRPTIQVDGEPIPTPNAREVVFFIDRAPGTYELSADNDVRGIDEAPPESYRGQTLSLEVESGRLYYVKMIRHGPDNIFALGPQQHYLELEAIHHVRGEVEIGRYGYGPY